MYSTAIKYIRVALFTLILCSAVFFQKTAIASTDETITALNKLKESVVVHTLSNGITVLLHKRGVAPIFAGSVVVGVGGADEFPGQTGISHLLEHMAFKGTSELGTKNYAQEKKLLAKLERLALDTEAGNKFTDSQKQEWENLNKQLEQVWDSGAFDREFQLRGAVGMNATTAKELTTYFVNLPSNQIEYWAWIESERIINPVMRQFYQERDVVMEERRMRYEDSPVNLLYEHLLGVAYQKHSYRNPVIGYPEDIKHLTASATLNFHKHFYVPQNIAVAIVGDIDIPATLKLLERYFGRIKKGADPQRPRFIETEQIGERVSTLHLDAEPTMLISYHKPAYPHVDDAPLSIMQEILAGSRVARLPKYLVETKKIANSVSVFEAPGSKYPNLVVFNITPRAPANTLRNLQEFDRVLEEFKKNGPSLNEVEVARRSLAMSFLKGLNDNSGMANDLASLQMTYGDWKEIINWYNQLMDVSIADVTRVAKQYLVANRRVRVQIEKVN